MSFKESKEWGCYVLHNIPFYFIEKISTKSTSSTVVNKVVISFYELQKSAANWNICDYGVTKSPDCNT
jgi:hypothetical protein